MIGRFHSLSVQRSISSISQYSLSDGPRIYHTAFCHFSLLSIALSVADTANIADFRRNIWCFCRQFSFYFTLQKVKLFRQSVTAVETKSSSNTIGCAMCFSNMSHRPYGPIVSQVNTTLRLLFTSMFSTTMLSYFIRSHRRFQSSSTSVLSQCAPRTSGHVILTLTTGRWMMVMAWRHL